MGEFKHKIQNYREDPMKRKELITRFGALIVFLVLVIINLCITPNFFSMFTVWNIIIQSTPVIFVAMGMTFVIAIAGIDISVGSGMALCATITAALMSRGYPVAGCVMAGLLAGFFIGGLIGVLNIKFNIQPMVLTLAFMIILRSASRIAGGDQSIQVTDEGFIAAALTRFGMVPIQVIYVAVIVAVFYIIAEYTVFGKSVEAIGNNSTAAKLSGIRSDAIAISTYLILGGLVALAAMLTVARSMNCNPSAFGTGMEMDAIAAVVIGGTSMAGGKPRIIGSFVGCLIITLITMTVNMNGIDASYAMIIKAFIIVSAVYIQSDFNIKPIGTRTVKSREVRIGKE